MFTTYVRWCHWCVCVCVCVTLCTAGVLVTTVSGHYSLRMHLSSSVVSQGDSVSVTCEIHNKLNASPPTTFLFVKKTPDNEHVKIASNHVVEKLFQQSGRYRVEPNDTYRPRHVLYTLRIASMSTLSSHSLAGLSTSYHLGYIDDVIIM